MKCVRKVLDSADIVRDAASRTRLSLASGWGSQGRLFPEGEKVLVGCAAFFCIADRQILKEAAMTRSGLAPYSLWRDLHMGLAH